MEKEKNRFSNFSRDKWIAGVFVIIILCVPVLSIFSQAFAWGTDTEGDEGQAVLEGNGTALGNDSEEAQEPEEQKEEEEKTWIEEFRTQVYGFTDELYLKDEMIAFSMAMSKAITGNTYIESTQVLQGKESWLFYKTANEGDGNPIYDFTGINRFLEKDLVSMAENLTAIRDCLAQERGIRFVAMCLPNKENLYPEYMPDTILKLVDQSRAGQAADYLHGNTDLEYVYPMEELLREKEKHILYYMTDTHWNEIGAFVGLQTFFKQIYGTYASPESVRFIETSNDFAGDLATIAGLEDDYRVDTTYVLDKESVDPAQYHDQVLLIVGDSFSGFLSDVAKPYYREVYRIETKKFSQAMLDKYQPDIVIWQTVERRMDILKDENILEK